MTDTNLPTESTKFTAQVVEDPDTKELVLVFPESMVNQLDWRPDDIVDWQDTRNTNGGFSLVNKSLEERKAAAAAATAAQKEKSTQIYIVETVSTFKMTYAVRAQSLEHAYDAITCNEADELKQDYLGETIFGGKEITEEEYLTKEIKDLTWMERWSTEQKLKNIHTIDYKEDKEDKDLSPHFPEGGHLGDM